MVNDGIASALERARDAAGDRDVRIGGGANTIVQFLNARLVDEFTLSVAPVVFGGGTPLFNGVDRRRVALQLLDTIASAQVTHLGYRVMREEVSR